MLTEPLMGFSAAIASPQITSHDRSGNDRVPIAGGEIAFSLIPDAAGRAQLFITLNEHRGTSVEVPLQALERDAESLQSEAASPWVALRSSELDVVTPHPEI